LARNILFPTANCCCKMTSLHFMNACTALSCRYNVTYMSYIFSLLLLYPDLDGSCFVGLIDFEHCLGYIKTSNVSLVRTCWLVSGKYIEKLKSLKTKAYPCLYALRQYSVIILRNERTVPAFSTYRRIAHMHNWMYSYSGFSGILYGMSSLLFGPIVFFQHYTLGSRPSPNHFAVIFC
jgi:hypothetical protein